MLSSFDVFWHNSLYLFIPLRDLIIIIFIVGQFDLLSETVDHRLQLFLDVEVFGGEEELHCFLKARLKKETIDLIQSLHTSLLLSHSLETVFPFVNFKFQIAGNA